MKLPHESVSVPLTLPNGRHVLIDVLMATEMIDEMRGRKTKITLVAHVDGALILTPMVLLPALAKAIHEW